MLASNVRQSNKEECIINEISFLNPTKDYSRRETHSMKVLRKNALLTYAVRQRVQRKNTLLTETYSPAGKYW